MGSRINENTRIIETIRDDANSEKVNVTELAYIVLLLSDISKSLAIIADSKASYQNLTKEAAERI